MESTMPERQASQMKDQPDSRKAASGGFGETDRQPADGGRAAGLIPSRWAVYRCDTMLRPVFRSGL